MAAQPAGSSSGGSSGGVTPRKEIYSWEAPWSVYALSASQKAGQEYAFRYAVGSFIEEYCNKIEVS
jgi:DDB1- and CUL4-associated factor 7